MRRLADGAGPLHEGKDDMVAIARPRAALGVKRKNVPGVLFRAQAVHDGFEANPGRFGATPIAVPALAALIAALAATQQSAREMPCLKTRTLRDTRRDAVWTALETLCAFVQALADALGPGEATSLISAAGLLVAKVPVPGPKAILEATLTATPGLVHLDANASLLVGPADRWKLKSFHWQWSGDGGATWNDAAATGFASTDIAGLALLHTYSFRVCVTVSATTGAWSQAATLLVH